MKTQFVMRTKTPAQYFRGEIKKGFLPISGKLGYFVSCLSYAGGNRNDSPVQIINWQYESRAKLLRRLKSFAKRGRYIYSFNPNNF